MDDDRAFLRMILAEPRHLAARLIYADWLEERGDPRGEFIRVQMALAEPHQLRVHEWQALAQRDAELWRLLQLPRYLRLESVDPLVSARVHGAIVSQSVRQQYNVHLTYRRGFVERVTLDGNVWVRCHAQLTSAFPLRDVQLSSLPTVHTQRRRRHSRDSILAGGSGVLSWLSEWPPATGGGSYFLPDDSPLPAAIDRERLVCQHLLRGNWPGINFELPMTVAIPAAPSSLPATPIPASPFTTVMEDL